MSKLNQTWYGVSPVYIEYKMKRIFATAGLEKSWSSYGNLRLFRRNCGQLILKIGLFHRVKELSKSNDNWYGVSSMYQESNTKRIFAIACLGKKLGFHTEICEFREKRILTIVIFDWVKELSKSNQRTGIFSIGCLGKKLVFHTEIFEFHE